MRTPKKYVAKDGAVSYKVRYRFQGEQTSTTFDGDKAEKQALEFAKELDVLGPAEALRRLQERAGLDPDQSPHTVDDVWQMYITWKADEVESDRTIHDYQRDYDNYVKPVFGELGVDEPDEKLVQAWVDTLRTGLDWIHADGKKPSQFKKLSGKSIHDRHALLSAMYKWAIHPGRGYAKHNPCGGTTLPRRKKTPPKGLRPAEWQALAPALRQTDPDGADLADFLLASAWRWSEATALDSDQVEDYETDLFVTMARVVRRNAANQHVIVDSAKSDDSLDRRIKIDPDAADIIRARLKRNGGKGLVFTKRSGVKWHYSNYRRDVWDPAVKLADLSRKPTPHWLRHTHVGWLIIGRKVNLVEIQRRVGHASITTTTEVYGKMVDDISDDALDAFAAMRRAALKVVKTDEAIVAGEVVAGELEHAPAAYGEIQA